MNNTKLKELIEEVKTDGQDKPPLRLVQPQPVIESWIITDPNGDTFGAYATEINQGLWQVREM